MIPPRACVASRFAAQMSAHKDCCEIGSKQVRLETVRIRARLQGMPQSDRKTRAFRRCCALSPLIAFLLVATALAQTAPLAYTVTLASPEQHLVEVRLTLPPAQMSADFNFPSGTLSTRSATSPSSLTGFTRKRPPASRSR